MNFAFIQAWIDSLVVGTTFQSTDIPGPNGSPTVFGRSFSAAVANGQFMNVRFVRTESDNHHVYERI